MHSDDGLQTPQIIGRRSAADIQEVRNDTFEIRVCTRYGGD